MLREGIIQLNCTAINVVVPFKDLSNASIARPFRIGNQYKTANHITTVLYFRANYKPSYINPLIALKRLKTICEKGTTLQALTADNTFAQTDDNLRQLKAFISL